MIADNTVINIESILLLNLGRKQLRVPVLLQLLFLPIIVLDYAKCIIT